MGQESMSTCVEFVTIRALHHSWLRESLVSLQIFQSVLQDRRQFSTRSETDFLWKDAPYTEWEERGYVVPYFQHRRAIVRHGVAEHIVAIRRSRISGYRHDGYNYYTKLLDHSAGGVAYYCKLADSATLVSHAFFSVVQYNHGERSVSRTASKDLRLYVVLSNTIYLQASAVCRARVSRELHRRETTRL